MPSTTPCWMSPFRASLKRPPPRQAISQISESGRIGDPELSLFKSSVQSLSSGVKKIGEVCTQGDGYSYGRQTRCGRIECGTQDRWRHESGFDSRDQYT